MHSQQSVPAQLYAKVEFIRSVTFSILIIVALSRFWALGSGFSVLGSQFSVLRSGFSAPRQTCAASAKVVLHTRTPPTTHME